MFTAFPLESHAMLSRSKSKFILEFQKRRHTPYGLGYVSEAEIKLTKLPSITCKEVNQRAASNMKELKTHKPKPGVNDDFYIKTSDTTAYGPRLSVPPVLQIYPTSMCPHIENHFTRVYVDKLDLPVACPTCWSLQRNA
jgi:hypothetical protein